MGKKENKKRKKLIEVKNSDYLKAENQVKEFEKLLNESPEKINQSFKKNCFNFQRVKVSLNGDIEGDPNGEHLETGVIRLRHKGLKELLKFILSLVILISITGLIPWIQSEELIYIIISILFIVVCEKIGYWIINRFFFIYKYKTLGSILLIPTLAAFMLVCIVIPNITIYSALALVVAMILYLIFRKILFSFIKLKGTILIRRD